MPAASVALTENEWLPAAKPVYAVGLVQLAKAPPSSEHWNVEPASDDVKLKLALVTFVGLAGAPVSVVLGAAVSTVQVRVAGVASVFESASVALTWNVCDPTERPV